MKVEYVTHYDKDYWTGKKTYQSGNEKAFYHGPGLAWDGFDFVADALAAILPKNTLLDVGCGGGDLARRLKRRGFDPYGIDISEYAVENALVDMRDRLHICDASTAPKLPPHFPERFRTTIATDFLEHIYEEDLGKTFQWIHRHTERWMFFCVATASHDKGEFVLKKGQPVPMGYEGVAVSGHVNVRTFAWWARFFEGWDLKIDWRRMYLFQTRRESVAPWRDTMGWNMQTTFVLEKP